MSEDLIKSMPLTMSDIVLLARNRRNSALEILIKSAQYGDGVAQYELGKMYLEKLVDSQNSQSENIKQGLYWLELCAIKKNCIWNFSALNIIQDFSTTGSDEGLYSLLRIAESGFSYAQYQVALMYCEGNGFEKDEKKGLEWLTKSANNGCIYALHGLGFKYLFGIGVDENYKEAFRLFKLAADRGFDDSQYQIGLMFENGVEVEKDTEEAIKWYAKAADNGHYESIEKIKEFANSGYKSAVKALDQIDVDEEDEND